MLAHSFFIESSSKLTRTGIKARTSSISGLWFPWPIYMCFEMRFDSGERSLPFGLLVVIFSNFQQYFYHRLSPYVLRHMSNRHLLSFSAIFPDVLLVIACLLIFLVIVDIFIVLACIYLRYKKKKEKECVSHGFPRYVFSLLAFYHMFLYP